MTFKDLFKSKKAKETASQATKQEDAPKKASAATASNKTTTAPKP